MEAPLTFGEYIHRRRRAHKWTLHRLSEESGISYAQLSRLENDSVIATAESVAKLAQALGGDIKVMLELADCLPRLILDRISDHEQDASSALNRTAGLFGEDPDQPPPGADHPLTQQFKDYYGLDEAQAGALALALDDLVQLEDSQRGPLYSLIHGMSSQGR